MTYGSQAMRAILSRGKYILYTIILSGLCGSVIIYSLNHTNMFVHGSLSVYDGSRKNRVPDSGISGLNYIMYFYIGNANSL